MSKLLDLKAIEDQIINELYEDSEVTDETIAKVDKLTKVKEEIHRKIDGYISVLKYRLPKEKEILKEKQLDIVNTLKAIERNEEFLKSILFQCAEDPLEGTEFVIKQAPTTRKSIDKTKLKEDEILSKVTFKLPEPQMSKYQNIFFKGNADDAEYLNAAREFFELFFSLENWKSTEELPLVSLLPENHPAIVKTQHPNIRIIKK